jgi:SecD/SecF fusion protein
MRNKSAITVLTIVITALCLFALSFSYVERREEQNAIDYATNSKGEFNESKKRNYIDSIYEQPVYNFLGYDFTYKEVKENALGLGLDLKGGMHVTLELSPSEILIALAGNNPDPAFRQSLKRAEAEQSKSTDKFTDLFYKAYREQKPEGTLKSLFQSAYTKGKIDNKSSDADVMKVVNQEVDKQVDIALLRLTSRIDKFGVTSPNIQRIKGTNRILVELPGVTDPDRVRKLIKDVAQLEFLEVRFPGEINSFLVSLNNYLLAKEKKSTSLTTSTTDLSNNSKLLSDTVVKGVSARDDSSALKEDSGAIAKADSAKKDTTQNQISSFIKLSSLAMGDQFLRFNVKDTARINRIMADPKVKGMIPANTRFFWEKKADPKTGMIELVPVKRDRYGKNILTGEVITKASANPSPQNKGEMEVNMSMNGTGAKKWKKMTEEAIRDPQNKRRIAIVLDSFVYSAPTVQNVIPNGSSSITGNFTTEEAKDLANVLEVGKMPAPVRIVEEAIVGPSLGQEAISQGLNSALLGMLLVVVFMMVYYGKGGFVADFALLFNIFFILGILAQPQLGTVLTLPGIAGIVLTMGMSVDANVLIFERIREELRNGKSVSGALALGYDKAFSSIFDSNFTTIISALILAFFGSGPVKGFAVTLIIGIITSFFTSVYITRVILEWMDKRNMINAKSFETGISKNFFRSFNFDFIGNRKKAYLFSSTVIAIGIAAIIFKGGLTLGVDFKGGRSYIVKFDQPVEASEIKSKVIRSFENKGTEVKIYGDPNKVKITTTYLVDDESAAADEKVVAALKDGLQKYSSSNKFTIEGSTKVGATIADDIKRTSGIAIILSLIAIFLYVFMRFQRWQFGAGGLIALGHDVLMCIAAYGIAELIGMPFEVDQVFIAAILTIIGYSINDTVVVFDRIRETMALNPRLDLKKTMNLAINDTISRTIVTASTVFIVSLVLFIFGGETLRGFSLVMLIGCTFGTYSTIFIASPIVVDFASAKQLEEKPVVVKKEVVAKKENLKA